MASSMENKQPSEETGANGKEVVPGEMEEAPPEMLTSDYYKVKSMPERFNHPEWFQGYNAKQPHPVYQTSNGVYGGSPLSVHTMPTEFHAKSQKFTAYLGKFGMFRNHSLNTSLDSTKQQQ